MSPLPMYSLDKDNNKCRRIHKQLLKRRCWRRPEYGGDVWIAETKTTTNAKEDRDSLEFL